MQSESNMAEYKSGRTTDKENETSVCGNQASKSQLENSRKRRRRRRSGKSTSDTSGTGSLTSTEYGECNIPISIGDKATNWSDMLAARISELESEANPNNKIFDNIFHSESDVDLHLTFDRKSNKYVIGDKNLSPASESKKRGFTSNIGEKKDLHSPEKNKVTVSYKVSRNDCLIRPVIYMADKATQTDLLPGPPRNHEMSEAKNITSLKVTSDDLIISDSKDSILHLASEQKNLEIISDKIDIHRKETALSSNLFSVDESFQSITEDFVRLMRISSASFGNSFIKCLRND